MREQSPRTSLSKRGSWWPAGSMWPGTAQEEAGRHESQALEGSTAPCGRLQSAWTWMAAAWCSVSHSLLDLAWCWTSWGQAMLPSGEPPGIRQNYLGLVLTQIDAFSADGRTLINTVQGRGWLVHKTKVIISQEVEYLSCLVSIHCAHVNPKREHGLFLWIPQRHGEMEIGTH